MIKEIQAKTLLSHNKHPDPWFRIKYGMNIYRGCEHQCIYCDSRSACYGIEDFRDILVKTNAIERLRDELPRKRKKGIVGTGAMSDPYTIAERTYGLTGQAMEVLAQHRFPVHIITKSDLILKDTETLVDISRERCIVSFTLTTVDDALARKVEPFAPSPTRRLAAMRALARRGIETGVTMMPILPFIEDSPENIASIVERAADAGASYILAAMGTTMRTGSREYFYDQLDQRFPGMRQRYDRVFGQQYECSSPYAQELYALLGQLLERHGIADHIPAFEPVERQLALW